MLSDNKHRDQPDPKEKEKGIAEHERRNDTPIGNKRKEQSDNEHDRDDSSIRETDDPKETDSIGGDIAGTAAGNADPDES